MLPGEVPNFTEQDIILHDGDIVFIESRETEFFYSGGLLAPGQHILPRDYDIDVVDAIMLVESRRNQNLPTRSVGGVSVLNQDVTVGASKAVVQRALPDGRYLPIEIDLYHAMKNPQERILIRPGDYVYLRYTPIEALFAFFERQLIEGFVIGVASSLAFGE